MPAEVLRSPDINTSDNVKISNETKQFNLDENNETDQDLIVLYMYILPLFQTHGVKVGMTKCRQGETFWHAIKSRISVQQHELALTDQQYKRYGLKREVIYWGVCVDTNSESFKDYHVHNEIMRECSGLSEREQEWFINVPTDDLINAFENCRKKDVNRELYTPRKEQQKVIDDLTKYFNQYPTGHRFLLNCKMRFGKSFTTYKYCEEINAEKILILTFVPAVESSWRDDLYHIATEYKYYTDANLRKDDFDLKSKEDPFVIFLSLQNYLGKDSESNEVKAKIKKLQEVEFDMVVLDEYHFGAWNTRTQDTFEDLDKDYQKKLKDTKDVIKKFGIRTKKTICLSGTPFRALAKGEFNNESSSTYSYFDEQKNKYPKSAPNDIALRDKTVVDEAYAQFPDMSIFGYDMKNLFANLTVSCFSDDKLLGKQYFSLNKFFQTKKEVNYHEDYVFIYEEEIKKWLNIIKGVSVHGKDFPYSNQNMLDNNKHTLWLMPTVSSCIAMARLLKQDDYFQKYQIINLSDNSVGSGVKALEYLRDNIASANNTNKLGSIAITVNKLTIGVTVKEWFSVFVLKDLSSPESYFQSIFRIQTPYVVNGEIKKHDAYVYDFNIDRAASLLLRYAEESSRETGNNRLQIAKLIVKYLPIFINGDMSKPISDKIFFELAEFGDTNGVPLSRKIADTARTTRIGDEATIDAMLNDPQCSDIIKHVFAHAKFNKSKGRTLPPPPEDGFNTELAKKGRDKGYELGLNDSKEIADFDDDEVQAQFEQKIKEYCDLYRPKNIDTQQASIYDNAFRKGYESGVNAPIKKMQCGKEDGLKFVDVVKNRFGEDIQYNVSTKQKIKNFVNSHLNNVDSIPEEYRGMLYRRWYAESFFNAVRKALTPVVDTKDKNSVEDADNVLKHILSRLFEFLYISVYRETTFNEIFKNADPNVFLEAVGISKDDFTILNKYHIFQEDVLNNYIHDFFVNESLGSSLDLTDEKVKAQYRNSFDWFGFGVDDDNEESPIQTQNEEAIEDIQEVDNEIFKSEDGKEIAQSYEIIKNALPDTVELITDLLKKHPKGLKSGKIAELLSMSKKEVNKLMYANRDKFVLDILFKWKLK